MPRAKKTKTTSTKTTKTSNKSDTPVETKAKDVTTPTVIQEVSPDVTAVQTLGDSFTELLSQLSSLRTQLTSVTTAARALQKRADRELKAAQKSARKRQRKTGNRAPSGFVKPTKISMELATFLGKPQGTEMARTEVTREINTYIRSHKLQDPANGRRILADAKLRKLLRLGKNEELTYFNLQRYMSPHFAKKNKPLENAC
jgi:upstream activation factor subunit UAF30